MLGLLTAGVLVLVGLDLYLSWSRMKRYGTAAELNPIARQIAEDGGLVKSLVFLGAWNLIVTCVLWKLSSETGMAFWAGVKSGLGAMQLKSLQLATLVERLLSKKDEST